MRYPKVLDDSLIGTYPAAVNAGGGYVWDAVLEYRVWCHRDEGDYYHAFVSYEDALAFSKTVKGAEEPLALVLQNEYIAEPKPGRYIHVKKRRITEWPVDFLSRPRRTERTIPNFLAPDAPANRLDILRGLLSLLVIALLHFPISVYAQNQVPIGSIQVSPGFYDRSTVIIEGYIQQSSYATVFNPYDESGSFNRIHAQIVKLADYTGEIDVHVLGDPAALKQDQHVQVSGQVFIEEGKAVIVTRAKIRNLTPP